MARISGSLCRRGPDGRVDVMFYDRRDDPSTASANIMARSYDGGATWTEVKVSSSLST
jgi:hypothetical protein